MEIRHLAVADRNIAGGEARVERQLALIKRLETRAAATDEADAFLDLLRQTLAGWNRELDLIVATLNA